MTNKNEKDPNRKYNLLERTTRFGKDIINFAKRIPRNSITNILIGQLVRAGTSVGANYCEADDSSTKKEFFYKIGLCRKESKESKYWLQMVIIAVPSLKDEAKILLKEAQELNLIFSAIINRHRK